MPATKFTHQKQIEAALHRALVEVFTLRGAGLNLAMASAGAQTPPLSDWTDKVRIGPSIDKTSAVLAFPDAVAKAQLLESITKQMNQAQERTTAGDALTKGQNLTGALEELVNESEEAIVEMKGTVLELQGMATMADTSSTAKKSSVKATKPKSPPKQGTVQSNRWGSGWRSISLADLEVKFAVSYSFQARCCTSSSKVNAYLTPFRLSNV